MSHTPTYGAQGHQNRETQRQALDADQASREIERLKGIIKTTGTLLHELNQPLMAISGYSELVSMNLADNDPNEEKILKIVEQADKMTQIIRKLQDINKYRADSALAGSLVDIDATP